MTNFNTEEDILDLAHIDSLCTALGPERLGKLLTRFLETIDEAIQKLVTAIDAQDSEHVLEESHQLKGVARNLGVLSVGLVAQHIEEACRSEQYESAYAQKSDLEAAHQACKKALADYLEKLT